jgi:hypothetical protein
MFNSRAPSKAPLNLVIASAGSDSEEKYPLPAIQLEEVHEIRILPAANEERKNNRSEKKHHRHHAKEKQPKIKTEEDKALARLRKLRSHKAPDFLDTRQALFQKSLEPQLQLKCALLDHFRAHLFWKAKQAAQEELGRKKEKKRVHFKV